MAEHDLHPPAETGLAAPAGPAPTPDAGPLAPLPGAGRSPQWRSEQLLGGASEARIAHGGAIYRLRLTMLGKLILTK